MQHHDKYTTYNFCFGSQEDKTKGIPQKGGGDRGRADSLDPLNTLRFSQV